MFRKYLNKEVITFKIKYQQLESLNFNLDQRYVTENLLNDVDKNNYFSSYSKCETHVIKS